MSGGARLEAVVRGLPGADEAKRAASLLAQLRK